MTTPRGVAELVGDITGGAELERALRQGLVAVEEGLRAAISTADPFVSTTSGHLVRAGGKRFRPLVTLLAAQYGDPTAYGVIPAAVVVELTHLATLYHDDVMDEAQLRRGADSANRRWGNSVAILTGDYLFARASELLADLGPEAVRLQARTFERLVAGQIRETVGPSAGEDPVEHYLRVVSDKTGSLIGTAARFGAMLSGAAEPVVEVLTGWGERIGVAFQLSDDLLDIAGKVTESGKQPGTDLREGVPTLPVLLLRRDAPADPLVPLLAGDLSDDADLQAALGRLCAHPIMAEARSVVQWWAEAARASLAGLPATPATAALAGLCDYVVRRTS